MNIKHGITQALRFGGIGFLIPASIVGLIAAYHFSFHDIHPMDREKDLAHLPMFVLVPSLGLAALFSLSAFATFTYNGPTSFMRSLAVVSGVTLVTVFATRPRFHLKTANPNGWMEIALPVAAAIVATIMVLLYNRMAHLTSHTNHPGKPGSTEIAG